MRHKMATGGLASWWNGGSIGRIDSAGGRHRLVSVTASGGGIDGWTVAAQHSAVP